MTRPSARLSEAKAWGIRIATAAAGLIMTLNTFAAVASITAPTPSVGTLATVAGYLSTSRQAPCSCLLQWVSLMSAGDGPQVVTGNRW